MNKIVVALTAFSILYLNGIAAAEEPSPLVDLEQAAKGGDLHAQVALGTMYFEGLGIPADKQKAIFWNARAAEKGSPEAMLRLGEAYNVGDVKDGKPRSETWRELLTKARDGAKEAADKGDPAAMYVVASVNAVVWDDMVQVIRLEAQTRKMFQQSAESGYVPAMSKMVAYENKEHPRDLKRQLDWAMKAAGHGSSVGMFQTGNIYQRMGDATNAKLWILRSAQMNDASGVAMACTAYKIRLGNQPEDYYKGCNGTAVSEQHNLDPTLQAIAGILLLTAIADIYGPHLSERDAALQREEMDRFSARASCERRRALDSSLSWIYCP